MYDTYLGDFPWRRFKEYISLSADRFEILRGLLEEAVLDYTVLEIAGNRHLVVAPPPPEEEYLRRPPVILVAHHDRAEGSSGANDNSAGVFILLEAAVKLKKNNAINWIVIFTDKEELKKGESLQTQGSFALATGLINVKMDKAKIFCFDACGAGDTLIISSTLEYLLKKEKGGDRIRESILELRSMALGTARNLGMQKVLLAPVPFSDDAGFFCAGLAAQTITILPSAECTQLISEIRKNPEFAEVLINAESRQNNRSKSIPETWRYLNTSGDCYPRLTPQHFRAWVRFAEALCK